MASLLDPSITTVDQILDDDLLYVVRPGSAQQARKITGEQLLQQLQGTTMVPAGTSVNRPGSPVAGTLYFDTDVGALIVHNGSAWVHADGSSI